MNVPMTNINHRLPESTLERAERYAARHGISRTAALNIALTRGFDEIDRTEAAHTANQREDRF